jgi:DNA adenine methylase
MIVGKPDLRAPFPWFGGKSRVASLVWERFGEVRNYVEPFAGSLAVLLGRATAPGIETVNDLDCLLANFWRALQHDPKGVTKWADNPVNEADQHARHLWLCSQEKFRERMKVDPEYYDVKIAGWWVWGQCIWIGSGWCARQLPHLGNAGKGSVLAIASDLTSGTRERAYLLEYVQGLAERLRRVRVCCGDWRRVLGPSPTTKQGLTGVFLDPLYADSTQRTANLYAIDSESVAHGVCKWAIEHGDDPKMRIALCGYEGEHKIPKSWKTVEWKARGGYSSQSKEKNLNPHKERIWFSPHCLPGNALRAKAA